MTVIFDAVVLFLFAFLLHIIIWRGWQFVRSANRLIAFFVSTVLLGSLGLLLLSHTDVGIRNWFPATAGDWVQCIVLALAISAGYIMTYPAVEVDSPTLIMTEEFARMGPKGVSRGEFLHKFDDEFLVGARIDDMVLEGQVVESDSRYRLTAKGRQLATLFLTWRHILGAAKGG